MILVDTSVWIDFFAGHARPHVEFLEQALEKGDDLALCGIVLTEILQGIREDKTHDRVQESLRPLLMLPMRDPIFPKAADIYRRLRKQGITIRKTNDCIIAATAMDHGCRLLHNDKDFVPIARHFSLEFAPR